jgi:hypothetical protein
LDRLAVALAALVGLEALAAPAGFALLDLAGLLTVAFTLVFRFGLAGFLVVAATVSTPD